MGWSRGPSCPRGPRCRPARKDGFGRPHATPRARDPASRRSRRVVAMLKGRRLVASRGGGRHQRRHAGAGHDRHCLSDRLDHEGLHRDTDHAARRRRPAGRSTHPSSNICPNFRVADAATRGSVTARHLLSHTSGIDGDFFVDSGRGDDAIARLIADDRRCCRVCFRSAEDVVLQRRLCGARTHRSKCCAARRLTRRSASASSKPLDMRHAMTLPRMHCAIVARSATLPIRTIQRRRVVAPATYLSHGQKSAGSTSRHERPRPAEVRLDASRSRPRRRRHADTVRGIDPGHAAASGPTAAAHAVRDRRVGTRLGSAELRTVIG